nr:alpha-galactosidase [Candidatus Sigynarchaeum springense]
MDFEVRKWIADSIAPGVPPLCSLKLGGKEIAKDISRLSCSQSETSIDNGIAKMECTYIDTICGLELKLSFKAFTRADAVDVALQLTNRRAEKSPVIQDIQVFDSILQPFLPDNTEYIVHRCKGSFAAKEDYQPFEHRLKTGSKLRFSPKGGRSSNTDILPFFNFEAAGKGGVIVAIEWSGQWASTIRKDKQGKVWFKAGMERTRLSLEPGETIRSPRLLLFPWRGSRAIDGHNALRRFFLQHYAPRRDGKLVPLPLACYGVRNWGKRGNEANFFTEENQKEYADAMAPFAPEVFWIDAGWFEGRWPDGVGSWIVRKDGFPSGLRPISDHVKKHGMKLLIWFEPERVHEGTWLAVNHPEWCLKTPKNKNMLLDLGNVDARKWLIDHLATMIEREGIGIFRLDFNHDPLPFWKRADKKDRQGMHEIRHVEGLYEMWDELQRRFPGIIFDNCASGGRRLDLETMSRCVALTRSDWRYYEPNGAQCHTHSINHYLPTTATFTDDYTPYKFRSSMTSGIMLDWDPFKPGFDNAKAKSMIDEFRQVRDLFIADFYPLTPYSLSDAVWCVYQFHEPSEGQGMVLAFRRQGATSPGITVALMDLDAGRSYEVVLSNEDLETTRVETKGKDLLEKYEFTIPTRPGSVLMRYKAIP